MSEVMKKSTCPICGRDTGLIGDAQITPSLYEAGEIACKKYNIPLTDHNIKSVCSGCNSDEDGELLTK